MHRFYLPPEQCRGAMLALSGPEAHHATGVLRVRAGESVIVLDGAGREFACVARSVERKSVTLEVTATQTSPAPATRVTLVQAVPKGKLIETIIQKATELGAHRIIPLLAERVSTRLEDDAVNNKADKWRHAAIEAVKQCGQRWLPRVEPPATLPALLGRGEKFDLSLIGSLRDDARHPRHWFEELRRAQKTPPDSICLWVGPEGDFTDAEIDAVKKTGARPASLGPLVLRCDTAALYVLSIVSYELQAWPNPAP